LNTESPDVVAIPAVVAVSKYYATNSTSLAPEISEGKYPVGSVTIQAKAAPPLTYKAPDPCR